MFDCFVFLLCAVTFESIASLPWEAFGLLAGSVGLSLTSTRVLFGKSWDKVVCLSPRHCLPERSESGLCLAGCVPGAVLWCQVRWLVWEWELHSQLVLGVSNRDKVPTLRRLVVVAAVQLVRGVCGRKKGPLPLMEDIFSH